MTDFKEGLVLGFIGGMSIAAGMVTGINLVQDCDTRPMPALIGHWCAGSGGDLWAMDESDFPTPCVDIERY